MLGVWRSQLKRHDDVRDNNACFVKIMATLKAKKALLKSHMINQNITLVVISYEGLFDRFHMK